MERREGMQPQYVQIEGPVALEPGQNFYDQPPFNSIFSKVAEAQGLRKDRLQHILTGVAREIVDSGFDKRRDVLRKHEGKQVGHVIRALEVFPHWDEYIFQKLTSNTYNMDGTFARQEQSRDTSKTPSYGAWLENKLTRNSKIQSAAIKSVAANTFYRQSHYESIPDVPHAYVRKWLIRKASGIQNTK